MTARVSSPALSAHIVVNLCRSPHKLLTPPPLHAVASTRAFQYKYRPIVRLCPRNYHKSITTLHPSHTLNNIQLFTSTLASSAVTMSSHSAACCKIPPVIPEGYTPKGEYITINGLKTYVTGPKDAETAIISFYDIFGFVPQTIQGADILAHADHSRGYQVYIPDFFEGNPMDPNNYPPDTEEKKGIVGKWMGEVAAPPKHLAKVQAVVEDAQKYNANIKTWGMIGYCWGGKMASLIAGRETVFKAAVQTSPAMVDPKDAEKVTIPMCVLASMDESPVDVKAYEEALKGVKYVETFGDVHHGFMSARGKMDDHAKAEYERGYKIALTFFHDNL